MLEQVALPSVVQRRVTAVLTHLKASQSHGLQLQLKLRRLLVHMWWTAFWPPLLQRQPTLVMFSQVHRCKGQQQMPCQVQGRKVS